MKTQTQDATRGKCITCGVKPCKAIRKSTMGFKRYAKFCTTCDTSYKYVKNGKRKTHTEQLIRKICPVCNKNLCKRRNITKLGFTTWLATCAKCDPNTHPRSWKWAKHKKDICEICGFVPVHTKQLDVHHLDHNKQNNDISNLQTVCANCHRLLHFG